MSQRSDGPPRAYDAEAAAWLYTHSRDGFALVENGRIVSANPAWCRMHGYDLSEVIGQHALKTIHPDDRQIYFDAAAALKADGQMTMEHRVCTGDGRVIWAQLAVKTAQDGLSMVVMKDITAERLQKLEQEHASHISDLLSASAGVSMWSFDPQSGQFIPVSGHGRMQAEGGSGHDRDKIHPDDRAAFDAVFNPTVKTGEAGSHTYRYAQTLGDGTDGWARHQIAWRGIRQRANGDWEISGLTQDVTVLADARDAALRGERAANDAAETKAHFLSNMSHEIRTPLNGVLGVLHLLKREPLSQRGFDQIDQALGCGAALTKLLNDVLDFSKLESGELQINSEPFDAKAALLGVLDFMGPDARAKGLELRAVVDVDPGSVVGDPARFRQILFNLLGNAVKFTPTGWVEVRLSGRASPQGHRLRVDVQDTGVGVAPEAMAALFERFQQADGSATRRFGGVGLGLAITQSLVTWMDGAVFATSVLGQGSTFSFEIAAPLAGAVDDLKDDDVGLLQGVRILVVEDNPTNQMIARGLLESLGAVVETADDGALGLEAVQHQRFDLVFMDIQMPVMGGVEASRRIRALPGPAAELPIIAVTANVMDHQIAEYRAVGMDGVIAKPLSPSAIIAEILRLSEGEVGGEAADEPAAA